MDVVRIGSFVRRTLSGLRLVGACALLGSPLWLGGCDDSEATLILRNQGDEADLGRVEFNLIGQGTQGTQFRLRDAVVMVQGPDQTLFFDSEEDPNATSFEATVTPGSYSSFLQEGWRLERVDTGKTVVDSILLSPNPSAFEVFAGERTRVALRFRAGTDVVVVDPGEFEIVLEVEEETPPLGLCSSDADCAGGAVCCSAGFLGVCQLLEPGAECLLPDLTVSADVAQQSLVINNEFFPADSCAIEEGCVVESGTRKLLRFSTMTPNVGDTDLILGDPTAAEGFEFAPCHNHFHFNGYARYELLDAAGAIVARGHKQAFCLLDSVAFTPDAPTAPRYHCGFQGLTRGWADIYDASLDCQWVDITGVPDGDYKLRISINPDQVLQESSYENNTVEVPVTIAPPPPVEPLSECTVTDSGTQRECGWQFAKGQTGVSCVPGTLTTVGCGCAQPASCSGDPMLRVCEGSQECGSQSALASVDDTCGVCPQLEFTCPPSGVYSVLTASFTSGQPFSCTID